MPVFQIGLDDGRSLRIEADSQEAALAGAQHFTQNSQPSTGYADAFKQGFANLAGGVGETLNDYVSPGAGDLLTNAAKNAAPANYDPAKVISDKGISLSALPRAAVENAPGMAASVAAARFTPGPAWLKLLAGSGVYALQTLGNKAKQRAVNNTGDPNAVPTTSDKAEAALATIPEAAIGAVGINRFLPKGSQALLAAPAIRNVGLAGVKDAVKKLAATAAVEAGTGATQDVVSQLGNTVGTNKGAAVDPYEVANAGVTNAATGTALSGPRAALDVAGAYKFRKFTDADAVASVANDVQNKAGGEGKLNPGFFNSRGGEAFQAVQRAEEENRIQLKQQIDTLKQNGTTLPADAEAALNRAVAGSTMHTGDHEAITNAVNGTANGDLVSFLARKAAVFPQLKSLGSYSNKLGNFTGGPSGRLLNMVREHGLTSALAALVGASEGAHLIAFSPERLAALAGLGMGSRLVDRFTGNLNPASRFINRFADPSVTAPSVQAAPTSVAPPVNSQLGPWGLRPTPPAVPTVPQGRNAIPRPPAGFGTLLQSYVAQQNRADRQQRQQTVSQTMPLLRRLANSPVAKNGIPILAGVVGSQMAGELGGSLAHHATAQGYDRFLERINRAPEVTYTPQQSAYASQADMPSRTPLPKDVIANSRSLVRGLQSVQKMKQRYEGEAQADKVAEASPLVALAGGPDVVANPVAGTRMSQMVNTINALKRLQTQYTQGAAPDASQVAPQKIVKTNGKVAEDQHPFPQSSFADLPAEVAAHQITKMAESAGNVKYMAGYRASTLRRIQGERAAMQLVGNEVPGLPVAELTARLEGVPDQKTARAFRDYVKAQHPEAAKAIDQYLSDEVISRLWKVKGK